MFSHPRFAASCALAGDGDDGGGGVSSGTGASGDGGAIDSGAAGVGDDPLPSCKTAKCDPVAECNDDTGEVVCACPAGYDDPKHDGTRCVDCDECELETVNCHANADCVNGAPGFKCRCSSGFHGDGVEACEPNALCDETGSNCAAEASCKTQDTIRYCVCNAGYLGNGEACDDIDECADDTDDCDPTTICMNAAGSFSCLDCVTAADCDVSTNPCQVATCSDSNVCGLDNLPNTIACAIGHCDGMGACKCSQKSDCPAASDACISGSCVPTTCGDGMKAGSEECDDANNSNTDACTNACNNAYCGDGFTHAGVEACDDGNNSNTDDCINTCVAAKCGDGFTRGGVEVCDDGNNSNTDACTNACVAARCGDTFIRAGVEECDDGNSNNSDACVQGCANAECGDGFVRSSVEECEIGVAGWTSTTCRAADCGRNYYRKCSSSSPCAAGETCAGDVGMCTTLVAGNYNACKDPPPNYSKWGADDICAMECLVGVCPKDLFCVTDSSKQFVGTCVGSGPAF